MRRWLWGLLLLAACRPAPAPAHRAASVPNTLVLVGPAGAAAVLFRVVGPMDSAQPFAATMGEFRLRGDTLDGAAFGDLGQAFGVIWSPADAVLAPTVRDVAGRPDYAPRDTTLYHLTFVRRP